MVMKNFFKQNVALILAIILPIILILVVAINAYWPSIRAATGYNFLYATCDNTDNYSPYSCQNYLNQRYSVTKRKLMVNEVPAEQTLPNYSAHLFLHDTAKNESREVTLETARELTLSELLTSPDGVTVSSQYNRGADFFPFFNTGSSCGLYLTKGKRADKLNLINASAGYCSRDNFKFIGWVLSEKLYRRSNWRGYYE